MSRHPNRHKRFKTETLAHFKEAEDIMKQRQGAMEQCWADLDQGWEDLRGKMREVGLSTSSAIAPDTMILLNVGGSDLHVPRSVLEAIRGSSATWTLGDLFVGGEWDGRLPRDSDGNAVLDASPACVGYLMKNLLSNRGPQGVDPGLGTKDLPADELSYLPHVAGALQMSSCLPPPTGVSLTGGSTVVESWERNWFLSTVVSCFRDKLEGLDLLYRASRDGWTPSSFHALCDSSYWTITLVRVRAQGRETTDSVFGGFSSVSWAGIGYRPSAGAFLLNLKDSGNLSGQGCFQPIKCELNPGQGGAAVYCNPRYGPCFGAGHDLSVALDGVSGSVSAVPSTFGVLTSPYMALHRRPVMEVEVFRVRPKATTPPPTATTLSIPPPVPRVGGGLVDRLAMFDAAPMSAKEHEDDVHRFGISVAESLKAERNALHHAQTELIRASDKAAASRDALAAVYGPFVAAGTKDPVVELSVRGPRATARFTTLLSTLQACPDSALARRFGSNWTESEDAYGRPVIKDCSPAVFSKVLDVLRMRKRAAWAGSNGGQNEAPMVRVAVRTADREPFQRYVNMYFVGCERFITDCVVFQDGA